MPGRRVDRAATSWRSAAFRESRPSCACRLHRDDVDTSPRSNLSGILWAPARAFGRFCLPPTPPVPTRSAPGPMAFNLATRAPVSATTPRSPATGCRSRRTRPPVVVSGVAVRRQSTSRPARGHPVATVVLDEFDAHGAICARLAVPFECGRRGTRLSWRFFGFRAEALARSRPGHPAGHVGALDRHRAGAGARALHRLLVGGLAVAGIDVSQARACAAARRRRGARVRAAARRSGL